MNITSDQFRAARALLRLDQAEVARRAGVSAVTVRRLEAGGAAVGEATIAGVANVLEQAGAEFVEGGVRRGQPSPEEAERRYQAIRAIVERHPFVEEDPPFTEADLYDENGLPA